MYSNVKFYYKKKYFNLFVLPEKVNAVNEEPAGWSCSNLIRINTIEMHPAGRGFKFFC